MPVDARLAARAEELLARARGGEITYTAFLTPAEQMGLSRAFAYAREEWCLCGGYAGAERARMVFLPDYVTAFTGAERDALLADALADVLVPVEVLGSGYRVLAHRDFLGSVLNLGVERDAIGDLCVLSPERAMLFTDRVMADFLTKSLVRVAGDTVRAVCTTLPEGFDGGRRFAPVRDTVASPRADAVVAALANLSRERAQALFVQGKVEIDYESAEKPDRPITDGAVIVIRGCGKFVIRSLSDKTKKGRYLLLADRYI